LKSEPAASNIERILIVRLSAMGDVIHTLPAAQLLRDAFPTAQIGWLVEERWAELLCAPGTPLRGPRSPQRPLADSVHRVNLTGWRKSLFTISTAQQIAKVWNDVRAAHYDIAVDLQGALRSALLARLSGARTIYGAAEPRESPASLWYTRAVIASGTHVVDQNISLAQAVAQNEPSHQDVTRNVSLPPTLLPTDPQAEAQIAQRLAEHNIKDFAILNPGAGWGAKRWPAERYGQVAKALSCDGAQSILNFGPGEETLAQDAAAASEGTAYPMKLSISELIALTRRAKLFIGGDTGPLHLAAALKIPTVAIFGPTDPARNGPYKNQSIVLRNPSSPTTHKRHTQADEAMLEISVEAAVAAARTLLASPKREGTHG
jgi:lipopolysaccharide heptosyltransferase I